MIHSCIDFSDDEGTVDGPGRGLTADGNPKRAYVRQENKNGYVNIRKNDPDPSLFVTICHVTHDELDALYALAISDLG